MRDEESGIGDVVGPDVVPDKAFTSDEGEHSHSGQGHRQLQGQHQEHLGRGGSEPRQHSCHAPQAPRPTLPDEGLANALVIPVGGREVLVVTGMGWGPLLVIVPMMRC